MAFESGVSHADFWNMTFQEITRAGKGYVERELNKWKRARWSAAVFATVMGDGKKTVKPTELLKLPGDERDLEDELELLKERRKWRTAP